MTDSYEENLKDIRKKNLWNIVTGQLNDNSLRNKLDLLAEQIKGISMLVIQKLNSMSPFQLASFEFLDIPPLSTRIVINTADALWFYQKD